MKNKFLPFVLIIALSLPATFSLFKPYFFSTHDGITHVVRFAKFYQSLMEGNIIPRWADGIAFGFGSPVLMLNSYLPYLLASLPRLIGFTLSGSIEVVMGFSLIVSAITCYLWLKEIFGKVPGFIGAMLYVWAPYRFVDLYVRGAYPEHVSLMFPPLLLLAGFKQVHTRSYKWIIIGSLSLAGLILSHNVTALLFLGVYLVYTAVLILFKKNYFSFYKVGLSVLLGLLLTSFYWIPAFFEKPYTHLDDLNNSSSYVANFVPLNKIIYSKWGWGPLESDSPMSLQLGLTQELVLILFVGLVLYYLTAKGRKLLNSRVSFEEWVHMPVFSIFFLGAIFFITPYSSYFWEHISLLSFFLYPWRFLILAILSCSVMSAFVIRASKNNILLIGLLIVLMIYGNRNHLQLVGTVQEDDHFYQTYTDTTDIWGEFLPKSANLDFVKTCKQDKCVLPVLTTPPTVKWSETSHTSNKVVIKYMTDTNQQVTLNRWEYPTWQVSVDGNVLDTNRNNQGGLDMVIPQGEHTLTAQFINTPLRTYSEYLSILTILGLGGFLIFRNYQSFNVK